MFFNKKERDIIFNDQFIKLTQMFEGRFSIDNILSQADSDWQGKTGRVTVPLLKTEIQRLESSGRYLTCVCGPRAFTDITTKFLKDLGVVSKDVFPFT